MQEIVSELQDTAFPEGITLLSLATHTSGLPRQPANMPDTPYPLNPYANYTDSDLLEFLAAYTAPPPPPGPAAFAYSNLGGSLLGCGPRSHMPVPCPRYFVWAHVKVYIYLASLPQSCTER